MKRFFSFPGNVAATFRTMNRQEHFRYWVFPLVTALLLVAAYFGGPWWMQEIVAPKQNREFGLLENLDNFVWLILFVQAARFAFLEKSKSVRGVFLLVTFGSLFMFLEEIDYGLHWIELARGVTAEVPVRNLHNQGHALHYIREAGTFGLILLFIIVPYFVTTPRESWIGRFFPSRRLLFSAITIEVVGIVTVLAANATVDMTNGSLAGNTSEFEEVVIYYTCMLYLLEVGPENSI